MLHLKPSSKNMKLAFMFLTIGNHNQGALWEKFFEKEYAENYSIYCHPKFPEKVNQAFLKDNIIPTILPTEHGVISALRAIILLLKQAFYDQENEYFILLSESCVPLYSFQEIYNTLNFHQKSYIYYGIDNQNQEFVNRWRQLKDHTFVSRDNFAMQHTWFVFHREVVEKILEQDYTNIFEEVYAPDEHYFINLLLKMNFPLKEKVINQMVTFVNWQDYEVETGIVEDPEKGQYRFQKIRPKTYHHLSIEDVLDAKRQGCLFFRKVSAECDCKSIAAAKVLVSQALQLATQHHQANRVDQAEQIYHQILEKQPLHPEALCGLGILAQQKGKLQEAEKLLTTSVEIQPNFVKAWFSLGNLHQAQGELSAAAAAYRQALALQPKLVAIHNNLGYTLQQLGEWEEAIACYQKALQLEPNCIEADVNLGNTLYTQGQLSKEKQAHYAQLNYKLGLTRKQAGDLTNAIVYYRQALALQPQLWEAHYELGIVMQAQGELEEAIASYQTALELNPHNWQIYNHLGQIYQVQNNFTAAVAIYRQGLTLLNPHYAQAVAANPSSMMQTTPPIPQGEVTVGAYQFPAIPPVTNPQQPRPFWTVVIPVYNRTKYLLECLANILLQWSDNMEILVIDNASTSPIYELVNSLAGGIVNYYRNSANIGPTNNMNVGISLSRGEWVHVLHDDDSVCPGFYSRLQQSLKDCSDSVGAACTGFEYMNENSMAVKAGEINSVYGQNQGILQNWLSYIGVCGLVMTPALVIRRATHERLGGYSTQIPNINDWELHKRIAAVYEWWYEPEILARFRVHSQSGTSHSWNSGEMAVQVHQAIEMSQSYLPADCCAEITTKARIQNFNYCLANALLPLKNGNLHASFCIIQSALKIDKSPESVAKLFAWLTQAEAAPLRGEIITKLLSIPN